MLIKLAATLCVISLTATPPPTERRVAWAWAIVSNDSDSPAQFTLPCPCGYRFGTLEPGETQFVLTNQCILVDWRKLCRADIDRDGDVDGDDYAVFAGCFNGPGNQYPPACKRSDFDADNDVDGDDYSYFASCVNGAGNPARCMP